MWGRGAHFAISSREFVVLSPLVNLPCVSACQVVNQVTSILSETVSDDELPDLLQTLTDGLNDPEDLARSAPAMGCVPELPGREKGENMGGGGGARRARL